MFAIIQDRRKQYKVEKDQEFEVDLRDEKPGDEIVLDEVLYLNDGKEVKIGTPLLKGAKVTCEVIGQVKGKKVLVFKFKRRKAYQKRRGHRQRYVRVKVKKISA